MQRNKLLDCKCLRVQSLKNKKSILFPDSDCREGGGDRYSIPVICILTERWQQIRHRTFKVIYDCEQTKTIEARAQ